MKFSTENTEVRYRGTSKVCSSPFFGMCAGSRASKAWGSGILLAQEERALAFPSLMNGVSPPASPYTQTEGKGHLSPLSR